MQDHCECTAAFVVCGTPLVTTTPAAASPRTHTQCALTHTPQCISLSLVPQLVYCLHHFKGDEKARPFIHKLIDPSEPGPGKPDGEGGDAWWTCGKQCSLSWPCRHSLLVHILLLLQGIVAR